MKKMCRNGYIKLIPLVVMMLFVVSTLAACGIEGTSKGNYHLDVVDHTSDFYVNDFAEVFSEEEKNKLMENAVKLDEEYDGIQVVITTVNTLNSAVKGYEYVVEDENGNKVDSSDLKQPSKTPEFSIEQIGYSMYSEYGIGQDDMGVLILFATVDREVRIETGRNMQFYITDSVAGRILDDYGMEHFAIDHFAEGLTSVQNAVINEIKSQVSPDWLENSKQESKEKTEDVTLAPIVSDVENVSGETKAEAPEVNKENDSGKGMIFGFFGSIFAAIAAVVAFIRQKFKRKEEKASLEKAKEEEIAYMQTDFQSKLAAKDKNHETQMSALKRDYQRLIQVRDTDIQELNHDISVANQEISTLKNQLEVITDKFKRAQLLHPEYNFEEEVNQMIEGEYKATAKKIDTSLAEFLAISATKDNYDVFNRALLMFDSAQPEVKKYLTSDRAAIEQLFKEAVRLKEEHEKAVQEEKDRKAAKEAYEKIKGSYDKNPIGSHRNFKTLDAALATFLGLTVAQKAFFPDCKLLSELERVHRDAERDFNNYEAARKAESEVENIIGGIYSADEDDRDKLERAMRYYRNLSETQKAYFSEELLRKLRKLIDEADEDHRRQKRRREQQAAARRAQSTSRSSSFSSSSRSSFSGRRGRPGGGGASRRF